MTTKKEINNFMDSVHEIVSISGTKVAAAIETVEDTSDIYDDDDGTIQANVLNGPHKYMYMPFGIDNQLPFDVVRKIGRDEVMAENKFFNVLTCYGAGPKYKDIKTDEPTKDKDIRLWMMHNALAPFMLEQATDMKYFFFCVSVIILSKDGKQIVTLRHKEACYCRFEKADENGRINHVFYGNWRNSKVGGEKDVEVITLLDEHDPLGDLELKMGHVPGTDGKRHSATKERKFAILVRFPTPGCQYYPVPYYTSIFRGDWYMIKRLIGAGKKAMLKNPAHIKYQVEIHRDYWANLLKEERITDPQKQLERIKKEKDNIKKFLSGIENSDKLWISGYYINPDGHEVRMVRINVIDTTKNGGEYSSDIEEASNMACYADNIHPNLVGATPGKSQSNNSGSDKRELFTLKQSLEIAFHDLMAMPHNVVIHYNGWNDKVYPDVPIILLTTLDENTDAKKVSNKSNKKTDANDNN